MLGVKVLDSEDTRDQKKKRKEENARKIKKKEKTVLSKDDDRGGEGQAGHEMWQRVFAEAEPKPKEQDSITDRKVNEKPSGNHVDPMATRKGSFTVGDGGASWRMKALKRAQDQADEQGASLHDVVSQRWGSVSELADGAERAAPSDAHRQFNRGMKSKMKRPSSVGDQWRRGDTTRGSYGGNKYKRQRKEYDGVMERAAREMNQFQGDGSFLEQFQRGEGRGEKDPRCAGAGRDGIRAGPAAPSSTAPISMGALQPERARKKINTPDMTKQKVPQDNNSVAAMLRARLAGDQSPAVPVLEQKQEEQTPVHLPMVDAHGRAAPGAFGKETAAQAHRKPSDAANLDLQTMVRRVKHGTEEDMNNVIARNIARNTYYRGVAADDEYDYDAGTEVLETRKVSRRGKKDPNAELERKEKAKQINEYRRMTKVENQCRLCLDKNRANAHLTISMSSSAYLALPDRGRLVPGHCCVVPTDHIASARLADENTWEEMRNFKKCVLQMAKSKGMDCIFFETALDVTSTITKRHARIDCVPVSAEVMSKAPIYFKKAIEDATSDWAQHASKGCIETESRHLQRKIPPNFPYVHIEFGLANGYVSVIDEPKEFDHNFCRRVILGLLESCGNSSERNASAVQAKGTREGTEVQKHWVREFKSAYASHDWVV